MSSLCLFGVRTCSYECLACLMSFELLEVVDEHFSELVGLGVPFLSVGVSVAGIEDLGIYAGEFGGDGEVEDGELLGGSLEDSAVEDSVDDAAGILDRDALACTVPAGVHKISLGAGLLHTLNEFFSVLGGVQFEECLAETCREGGVAR